MLDRDPTRIDPDKPGVFDLFRAYLDGDRSPMVLIAVYGTCLLFAVVVVGLAASVARLG